ncbi:glycosyltransferase family 4 protein [Candidatus Woesearchaeota archaeon]|nr:glycosyltransferase family 4 protein [Candidatus Woesearchaeota archaeon]
MKIALLTPTFSHFSGIDRVVELNAKELLRKGHRVSVFCFEGDINVPKLKVIKLGISKNQTIGRIYRLLFFLDRRKIRTYGSILRNYDVVISHFYPMNLLAAYAKRKYGIRFVYHNHGVAPPWTFHSFPEKAYMWMFAKLSNWSIKDCDEAVSISKYLQGVLKRETCITSKVVYDPIDTTRFHPGIDGQHIRKKYHIPKDALLLFYNGRVSPHKGVHLLLDAFAMVRKKQPNAWLIISGRHTFPAYSKKLKEQAAQFGKHASFTGFTPDEELPHYYAACDVFVTCSLWEGFNMNIAEAQACGKPVVAFDVGPHREIVKRGKLVAKGGLTDFAEAVLAAGRNPGLVRNSITSPPSRSPPPPFRERWTITRSHRQGGSPIGECRSSVSTDVSRARRGGERASRRRQDK